MFPLRDYQIVGVDAVQSEFAKVRATLLEWATGLGKTVAAAELIRRWYPKPCLFICHRHELVEQAMAKIKAHTGLECLREQGNHRIDPDFIFEQNQPVVASVQSLNAKWGDNARRLHKFKPALLIIDEVHHARSETYERVVNYCGDTCKIVGITATVKRHDKKALGKIFQSVAHRYQIEEGVANGYLCDIAAESIMVSGLDYSKLRIVAGDFDKKELATMLEVEETVQKMIHPSLEIIFGAPRNSLSNIEPARWEEYLRGFGKPRKTLMFCASVGHAQLAADIFNRVFKEPIADWVCGETKFDRRRETIDAFRSGSMPILCNMGIATEGFDEPTIQIVLHGRPTLSLGLYQQMLGRVTRTLPGVIDGIEDREQRLAAIKASDKQFARNIDFVGNSDRLRLVSSVDVLGGTYDEETKQRAIARTLNKPVMISVTLSNMEVRVQQERKAKKLADELAAAERKKHLVAAAHFQSKSVNLFGAPVGGPTPHTQRTIEPATKRQRGYLGWRGAHPDWGQSKKQAGWMIGIIKANHDQIPPQYDFWRRSNSKQQKPA